MSVDDSSLASACIVDVLLPIRPPAPWLRETLESLAGQTERNWHLMAVIHGEIGEISELIQMTDPGATIVSAPGSATLSDVLNIGLNLGSAPFIARIDHDDIAEPERIAKQLQFMNDNPAVGVLCSPVILIDESGCRLPESRLKRPSATLISGLRWKNVIAHPSAMLRRSAVQAAGGYNSRARNAEDYDLWLRIASDWQVAEFPEPLLRYRVHSSQVSRTEAIPAYSRRIIRSSRLALARARGESTLAARARHLVWSVPQIVRVWQRGMPWE